MRPDPGSPSDWMERAESSLALARSRAPGVRLEDLCFQAQQAVEKALKAVFLGKGSAFPFVHDLDHLFQGLEELGLTIPEEVDAASSSGFWSSTGKWRQSAIGVRSVCSPLKQA